MAADILPASGDAPTPKTCDASGMAMVHRMFRAGFAEGPALVTRVADGDTVHAAVVADQLALLSTGLHIHHESEDQHLWHMLDERAPGCGGHIERMRRQHAAMVAPLRDLDAALPAWRATASRADAAHVLAALDGVNAALETHLPDEEANVVPIMETVITQKEADWFGEHGRASIPKSERWNALGMMMAAQPDGGARMLHDELPPPARVLWRLVGRRRYEKRRAALEGR